MDPFDAADRRDAKRARQNRGVRRGPAVFGDQPARQRRVHRHGQGRRQFAGDHDPVAARLAIARLGAEQIGRHAAQGVEQAAAHIADVGGALAQIVVGDAAKARFEIVQRLANGAFRASAVFVDSPPHQRGRFGIAQNHSLRFEDLRLGLADSARNVAGDRLQFRFHHIHGGAQAHALEGRAFLRNAMQRQMAMTLLVEQAHWGESDALANGQALEPGFLAELDRFAHESLGLAIKISINFNNYY
ncbi:MAG: hypothetical protein BWZ10_02019 [candidate division BRC1 bacterium ADurb.BinA364]|nr:MAG: hypothetical protein BWZ10_02019 [candidate division BRC1 bacterium ADurb.BinA364]